METMDAPVPEVRNESKPTRVEEVGQNLSASAIGDTMEPLMLGLYFIELLCTLCLSLKEFRVPHRLSEEYIYEDLPI
ncbi:hypothetical protein HanIR_Chr01g0028791 [Helianthus annuus]|nr:hypothetical protein HanIR_Chr01g0028791 [Helianthus annuus]